jgi:uncharacterized protein (DUF697 family)
MNTTGNGEYETEAVDLENDEFEFEMGDEFEFEAEVENPIDEIEEMELAAELLATSSEQELDQFIGKLFKKIGRGIRKVAKPLGGILKGVAKKALPFVGGALGSFIPIPGVGTAVGSALGSAASKLLEVDLEGMNPEDQEFELARRFVRMASTAAAKAASAPTDADPKTAAVQAVKSAAQQLGSTQGQSATAATTLRPPAGGRRSRGRWFRRGNNIVLIGA